MGLPTFDTRFEESGKFYVRNDILKFFILTLRRSNQGQVFKKRSGALFKCVYIIFSITQKQRRGRSKFCFLRGACLP